MTLKKLRIATRKSPLALQQSNDVRNMLLRYWPKLDIELVPFVTSGDRFLKDKLSVLGGKGLFTKELEEALLSDRADIAVHSMKDVPAQIPKGLNIGAVCKRYTPFDALLSIHHTNLATLPKGASIGTSSTRRQAQLLAIRPDLSIKTLRGNIHSRITKLTEGIFDAIILAVAGLERMGMDDMIREILSPEIMLPACGQGALGIEYRHQDETIAHLVQPLHDPITALCVETERYVNARLGGNCHAPLAVYASYGSPQAFKLFAKVGSCDGITIIAAEEQGHEEQALELAERCVQSLLKQGALSLLQENTP